VKGLSGKWLKFIVEPSLFSEVESAFNLLLTELKTTLKKEYFTMPCSYSYSHSPLQKAKYNVYPYSVSQRDFMHLNVRTEGTAL